MTIRSHIPGIPGARARGISLPWLTLTLLLLLLAGKPPASAQVHITGQAAAGWRQSQSGNSQYSYNNGKGSFNWRGDLFLDAELSDNVLFLSSFRMEQDRRLDVDLFVIRVIDIFSLPLSLEAGETDIPFGNLGERRFPKNNPFLTLPLGREHVTTLRSSDYELWTADARYASYGNGVKILDGGLYDIGVKAFGTFGIVDYAFAVTNGMLSATSNYGANGLSGHAGVGKMARISVTPMIGLTVGASYAQGPFLREEMAYGSGYGYAGSHDPGSYPQETLGADIDFSFEHFSFYGEAFFNRWDFAEEYGSPLDAFGYSAEARYTIVPRLSAGLRLAELRFNEISSEAYEAPATAAPWDRNVLRLEYAVGYRCSRETLLKAVYTWNKTFGFPGDPRDNTFGVQTVVSF